MAERGDICSICAGSKDEHEEMNHEFNLNNELIPKDRSTPKMKQPRSMPRVVGAYDIELRQILLNKGIISHEDFAALRNLGAGATGDRETGETEGSE